MALLFMDSMQHYDYADIAKKWTVTTSGSMSFAYDSTLPGGGGIRLNVTGNSTLLTKSLPSTYASGVVGCWFMPRQIGSGTPTIIGVMDSGTIQVDVRMNTSGQLLVTRNGTTLATSATALSLNTWYHVEFKFTINNTTGVIQVKVNGTDHIASTSSLNTRGSANNYFNQFTLAGNMNNNQYSIQGAYVCDQTGSSAADFLGVVRIGALQPAGAGNYAQWTPNSGANFASVGEKVMDGDTSWNGSSTANQIDSFDFVNLPSGSGTVHAIQHTIAARQDGGATRSIAPLQRSSGTDYVGTTVNLAAGYVFYTEPKSVNPATTAQYSVSEVNAAEFGYKLIS